MDAETTACQRILDAKTPFECFEIPRRTTDPELIRSIYLKLAIKVHPDKNKCHLATQAFQILSDSFEELHDEKKQFRLLSQSNSSTWHPAKKKKSKPQDIADLVQQNNRWYTRDWEEVEAEILRMTTEFKGHLARKQEAHERAAEKRAEKRERKNKRIKKNLNYLYEKYGIDPSDDDSDTVEASKNAYDYLAYVSETNQSSCPKTSDPSSQAPAPSYSNEVGSEQKPSEKAICWLCKRSFVSHAMLQMHYEKSELHRRNVEEAANPWSKFKNSFSEVKDPP